jgi:hypothetical protein
VALIRPNGRQHQLAAGSFCERCERTALRATGATVGLLSGGPPSRRALRQLLIGYGAAAVTDGLVLFLGGRLA